MPTDQQHTAITDLAQFSMLLQEVEQTATFIADTATLMEDHQDWDGSEGNPTPYYVTQLAQLVRQAANKQLSLMEQMECLTSDPRENSQPLLDVLQLPQARKAGLANQ